MKFNSKKLEASRHLEQKHLLQKGAVGLDCQPNTMRLRQYFYKQISVAPNLSITGKVELRNKEWKNILFYRHLVIKQKTQNLAHFSHRTTYQGSTLYEISTFV